MFYLWDDSVWNAAPHPPTPENPLYVHVFPSNSAQSPTLKSFYWGQKTSWKRLRWTSLRGKWMNRRLQNLGAVGGGLKLEVPHLWERLSNQFWNPPFPPGRFVLFEGRQVSCLATHRFAVSNALINNFQYLPVLCIYPLVKKLLSTNKLAPKIAKDLRETFKALDANGDGFLTINELRDGIEKVRGLKKHRMWDPNLLEWRTGLDHGHLR